MAILFSVLDFDKNLLVCVNNSSVIAPVTQKNKLPKIIMLLSENCSNIVPRKYSWP